MSHWKNKLKLRLPAILLLLASLLFWTRYDRYEPVGPMLLEAPERAEGTRIKGNVSQENGRFILDVPAGGGPARISFALPAATDYELIRVRARIKVNGVMVGKYPWSCARLLVTQYDAKDQWISGHHGLVAETGSRDWKKHADTFEMSSQAIRADVVLQQAGLAGTAEFDQIEAQPVRLRASFGWWRLAFGGQWLLAAALYFHRCRLHVRRLKILIALNVVAILAGTLLPSPWISSGTLHVKNKIHELRRPPPSQSTSVDPTKHAPEKKKAAKAIPRLNPLDVFSNVKIEAHQMGHFFLFASLCFLVYLSAALERQRSTYFFKVGFDIFLFAAITEALQFLTLDRTAGILDLRTDVYGMAAALLLFLIVRPFLRQKGAPPTRRKPCSRANKNGPLSSRQLESESTSGSKIRNTEQPCVKK